MRNRQLLYLYIGDWNGHHAGTKATVDALEIMKSNGYVTHKILDLQHGKVRKMLDVISLMLFLLIQGTKYSVVVFQYPFHISLRISEVLISSITSLRRKGITTAVIINDIHFLRRDIENTPIEDIRRVEIRQFNNIDYIISHNEVMTEVLRKNNVTSNFIELGLFDYLYSGECSTMHNKALPIVFAGNLDRAKSGFLYLDEFPFPLIAFGPNASMNNNVEYGGNFAPDELLSHLDGSFGLVWDGPSTDTCQGNTGEYLRYNNPHKCSLYIVAGLPILIWKEAALAQYVIDNKIGVAISSLSEIPAILNSISDGQYNSMQENIMKMRSDLVRGGHLEVAISKLE